jgi:hypothetical protein
MDSEIREQFTETRKSINDLGIRQREEFRFLLAQLREDDQDQEISTREWRLKAFGWGASACCAALLLRVALAPTVLVGRR